MTSLIELARHSRSAIAADLSIETVVFERPDRAVARGWLSGQHVFIKIDTSRDRAASERRALELVSGGGVPVPAVLATATLSDVHVLVLTALNGARLDDGGEQAWVEAGAMLAAVHRLRTPPDMGRARYGSRKVHRFIDAALEDARSSGMLEDASVRRVGVQLTDMAERIGPAPTSFVHGDLQAEHVLIGPDERVAGIVDWTDAGRGDPLFDISVMTLWHAERVGAVVTGYGSLPAPGTEARERIGMYWMLRHLGSAGWLAAHGYDASPHIGPVSAGVLLPDLP